MENRLTLSLAAGPDITLQRCGDVGWVATEPVTAEQFKWFGECENHGGFATRVSWLQARKFCRLLSGQNRTLLESIGPGYAVNLPTCSLWESALGCLKSGLIVDRDNEANCATYSQQSGESFRFVDTFYESCLDAIQRPHQDVELGETMQGNDGATVLQFGCNELNHTGEDVGALLPNIRDARGLWLNQANNLLYLQRSYTATGYYGVEQRGKRSGFRVAVHSLASGIATKRSPTIKSYRRGRVVVEGYGSMGNAKLFPGGAREWEFPRQQSQAHIAKAEFMELLEWGASEVVVGGFPKDSSLPSLSQDGTPIAVTLLDTSAAIETYNRLVAEGRAVGGLIKT